MALLLGGNNKRMNLKVKIVKRERKKRVTNNKNIYMKSKGEKKPVMIKINDEIEIGNFFLDRINKQKKTKKNNDKWNCGKNDGKFS